MDREGGSGEEGQSKRGSGSSVFPVFLPLRRDDPEYFRGRKYFSSYSSSSTESSAGRNGNWRRDAIPRPRIVQKRLFLLRRDNLRPDSSNASSSSSSSSIFPVIAVELDDARLLVEVVVVLQVVVVVVAMATDAEDEFHAASSTHAAVEILQSVGETRRRRSQVIILARLELQA